MPAQIPDKPGLDGLEAKWSARWQEAGVFRFDRSKSREQIYSIDTPPPTVSGDLHPGHVCSYTHTDLMARFWRMRGKEVFYPMGWDDNGLNVERRVQLLKGVLCDPALPYDPDFRPPDPPGKEPVHISRPNFVELCDDVIAELERKYYELWSTVGLSVDWSQTYSTISDRIRKVSQRGFLRLYEQGLAYTAESPTLWDVDYRTAVAQAELQDRELPGAYHAIRFPHADDRDGNGAGDGDGGIMIETTRPELIAACVALVAHPDDERYKPLFGAEVVTPLYGVRVPVRAHELADPEKGSGVAMICTFGDTTDVVWWRELSLPVRSIVQRDGRLRPIAWNEPGWESTDPTTAARHYDEVAGRTVAQAQRRVVEQLRDEGFLLSEPRPITHPVKFWENGNRPLEIVTSRQWFIRYPPKDDMLARGKELDWHPDFMRVRYENWVNGLMGDWNITRQRFFGMPFPVWYPITADGEVDHDNPLLPAEDRLPVDPSTDVPDGYTAGQRDRPDGFTGDNDVMDTWATSSLTPLIVSGWEDDPDLFARLYPMDLRPQAHEIIRTWLFYTIVRSHYELDSIPWHHAQISGFVVDPDRKKMSKSAGNAPDAPMNLIGTYGADAVRYWAAGARPGMDLTLDHNQFKIGRRLAIKILNVSRFVLSRLGPEADVTEALDKAMLDRLGSVVDEATRAFEEYDYARAAERIEPFFWSFCDDYVELVKGRAYGGHGEAGAASANGALSVALSTLLRLFAPFLPFVTEEAWSWWQDGSIHRASWPVAGDVRAAAGSDADGAVLDVVAAVLGQARKAKSEAKLSMRAPIERLVVRDTTERLAALRRGEADLRDAGSIEDLVLEEAPEPSVEANLRQ